MPDPLEVTGANRSPVTLSLRAAEDWSWGALVPSGGLLCYQATAEGQFIHAFLPSEPFTQDPSQWGRLKQRLDLHRRIDLLPYAAVESFFAALDGLPVSTDVGSVAVAPSASLPCSATLMFAQVPFSPPQSVASRVGADEGVSEIARRSLPDVVLRAFKVLSEGNSRPNHAILQRAEDWLSVFLGEILASKAVWLLPHVTTQDGGNVVFEWWKGRKSLSVYFSREEAWFLESCGSGSEQVEGNADDKAARHAMWRWLTE